MGRKGAYNVVQKHAGTLSAHALGRGTRMVVALPLGGVPEPT